ncbi:GTP 3',8-cyclase MoaA [Dehalobacterium formicoaceticum]|uniref:GTP 3',8-cyclase n=1 Tax=Dehalobacterium formicoaceticum TaxID=51515 RepID=A0ABT1Y9W2_9FIRM|nr:GTP 3',8-cyclase MoaA [Dehalobacterium formicoaceticum]MCR6546895.1 GTP 3',8-cyclase MoaA [Dehalobacterium formicoaceticum]
MIDNYGREINYLRISVTDLCNLKCQYCMPAQGVKKKRHDEIMRIETIEKIAQAAVNIGIKKIRLTGGEPLVRRGIIDLVSRISKLKFKGLEDLAMTTNGLLLEQYAADLKKAGLNRVNISLDTLDPVKYHKITRGGDLTQALKGIEAAQKAGLSPIKINVVLIGGFNDEEIVDFVNLTKDENFEVRFIELMPLGEASDWDKSHFLTGEEILHRVPQLIPLPTKGKIGVARLFKLPDSKGKVGLISPLSNHFCHDCNRVRITADGKLKPCLHDDVELDIRDYDEDHLEQFLMDGIYGKPVQHHILKHDYIPVARNMNEIGG